jgi:hypothetical protein
VKSTWPRVALPLYCLAQVRPASVVARILPAPATQPWLASVNWTASSAGAPEGDGAAEEGAPAEARAVPPGQDEGVADGGVADDAPAGRAEPALDELADVVAHPAARPAAANANMFENTVRRVIKGISYITFQLALPLLARP